MGDRGNIAIIHSDKNQVWLYSHWGGSELPEQLREGLSAGRNRWRDDPYLNKLIFGHVIPADNWQEECGYGISGSIGDNEHPITVCDIGKQIVFKMAESELKEGRVPDDYKPKKPWTFAEYVKSRKVAA